MKEEITASIFMTRKRKLFGRVNKKFVISIFMGNEILPDRVYGKVKLRWLDLGEQVRKERDFLISRSAGW